MILFMDLPLFAAAAAANGGAIDPELWHREIVWVAPGFIRRRHRLKTYAI
jgi:hypothetical protein